MTGVIVERNGQVETYRGDIVVTSCGAINSAALLLRSASDKHLNGLANSSGQVGRNLMFHPYCQVYGYFDQEMDAHRGPPDCIWSQQFYETDPARDFVRGYMLQFSRVVATAGEAVFGADTGTIPWGDGHHAALRDRLHHDEVRHAPVELRERGGEDVGALHGLRLHPFAPADAVLCDAHDAAGSARAVLGSHARTRAGAGGVGGGSSLTPESPSTPSLSPHSLPVGSRIGS